MADFDINAHLRQAQFGSGGSGGSGGAAGGAEKLKVNEDETPQVIVAGAEKASWNTAKVAMAIPVVGWFMQTFFPSNPGEVGIDAGLNSEGWGGKQIRVGSGGPQGGALAKIWSELGKNGSIPGGSPHGEGGGGSSGSSGDNSSSSGSGDYAGNHHFESSHAGLDFAPIIQAGGGHHFVFADVSERDLGFLRPSETPGGGGRGMGADMAVA